MIGHNLQRIQRPKKQPLHLFSTYYTLGISTELFSLPQKFLKKWLCEGIMHKFFAFEKPVWEVLFSMVRETKLTKIRSLP